MARTSLRAMLAFLTGHNGASISDRQPWCIGVVIRVRKASTPASMSLGRKNRSRQRTGNLFRRRQQTTRCRAACDNPMSMIRFSQITERPLPPPSSLSGRVITNGLRRIRDPYFVRHYLPPPWIMRGENMLLSLGALILVTIVALCMAGM
jgi:hypothetical protein